MTVEGESVYCIQRQYTVSSIQYTEAVVTVEGESVYCIQRQ